MVERIAEKTESRVLIIGNGAMGRAIGCPLRDNGYTVSCLSGHRWETYWGTSGEKTVKECHSSTVNGCVSAKPGSGEKTLAPDLAVLAINWKGLRDMSTIALRQLPKRCPLLVLTKGMAWDRGRGLAVKGAVELLQERTGQVRETYFLGGPCVASDLEGRRETSVLLVGEGPRWETVASMLRTPYLHVHPESDITGVTCSAALKNIYAVILGIVTGLLAEEARRAEGVRPRNTAAYLFTTASLELESLVVLMGGSESTARGLAGLGDLYVTCGGGRNHQAGFLIGQGEAVERVHSELMKNVTIEGLQVARELERLLLDLPSKDALEVRRFPLLEFGLRILVREEEAGSLWKQFWSRQPTEYLSRRWGRRYGARA